jgi:hypothetical protein
LAAEPEALLEEARVLSGEHLLEQGPAPFCDAGDNWALALDLAGETLQAEAMMRRAIRISGADVAVALEHLRLALGADHPDARLAQRRAATTIASIAK